MRASSIRRFRTFVLATGLSTLLALLTVGASFAGDGPGPWPK
jgi:hypothetical protein